VDTVAWIMNESKVMQITAQVKAMARKFTVQESHYMEESPDPRVQCGVCAFFEPPSSCDAIDAKVDKDGVCAFFVTKVHDQDMKCCGRTFKSTIAYNDHLRDRHKR